MPLKTTEHALLNNKAYQDITLKKMDEKFLVNCMTLYTKREFVKDIDSEMIINEFYTSKNCMTQLK